MTVDSLDIQISAQSDSAIKSLDRLVSKLNTLLAALGKIDTSGLTRLSTNAKKLASIDFPNFKNGLNGTSNAMSKAAKSGKNLALSFGKLYLAFRTIEKGAKALWKSVESSMDYIEVLNYFDAAFDQVAQKVDLSSFQELGYDSAEEYARSFSERAKELTAQMTGFAVTEKGTFEATGMPSLGLNPSQLMQYQAMFGQMASSMGVASETSLKLSRALTEIGADLASVRNMDFDKVWADMASGLAGMSRTLDKYGVNIRNVNLQQKLTELGINANIAALNQNDKALLRAIILLDSTRYAWGDLADTINQPANALRLTEASFQNLGRTIGNLFLPIVQKVLPYINALAIALQRLFTWVGNLLGIDLSKVTSSVGSTDFSNIIDGADDLTGGLNSATKAAEKLRTVTLGIDELNINKPQDDQGGTGTAGGGLSSGLLDAAFEDALSEYQKVWDEAFANMENRAQEMADEVEKALEPIKKIIRDFAFGDFFRAGKDVSNLVVSITDFFARAIDNVNWYGIGQKIGDFLAGIKWFNILSSVGNLIWQALKAAIELWEGSFDAAPIETAILSILALPALVGFGSKIIELIVTPFRKVFALLSPVIASIGGLFAEGGVFGAGGAIATASAPVLALTAALASLVAGLGYVFATNEDVRDSFLDAVSAIKNGFQPAIEFITDTILPDLNSAFDRLVDILRPLGEFLENTFTSVWQDMINPALSYLGTDLLPGLVEILRELWEGVLVPLSTFLGDVLEPVVSILSDTLEILWNRVVVPLAGAIGTALSGAFDVLKTAIETAISAVRLIINLFKDLWNGILKPFVNFLWGGLKPAFEVVFGAVATVINTAKDIIEKFCVVLEKTIGLVRDLIGLVGDLIEKITGTASSDLLSGFSQTGIGAASGGISTTYSLPAYAAGGFPEDGWFRASKGEYFGQFDDGTSYIANNNQIEAGIAAGVEEAAYRGMMRALQESGNASLLADIAENTRAAVDREIVARIDPTRETVSALRNAERRYGFSFT